MELRSGLDMGGSPPLDPRPPLLAMSLTVIGLRVPEMIIKNKTCVNKSFPWFWEL